MTRPGIRRVERVAPRLGRAASAAGPTPPASTRPDGRGAPARRRARRSRRRSRSPTRTGRRRASPPRTRSAGRRAGGIRSSTRPCRTNRTWSVVQCSTDAHEPLELLLDRVVPELGADRVALELALGDAVVAAVVRARGSSSPSGGRSSGPGPAGSGGCGRRTGSSSRSVSVLGRRQDVDLAEGLLERLPDPALEEPGPPRGDVGLRRRRWGATGGSGRPSPTSTAGPVRGHEPVAIGHRRASPRRRAAPSRSGGGRSSP